MENNPLLMTDGYKTSHHNMYPKGTTLVYSNFTPRNVKYMDEQAKDIVVFGIQYTMKYIHELYNKNFFNRKKSDVIGEAKSYYSSYLGTDYDVSHFESLYDLGYLPINVKGLEEGTIIKEKIPILTIYNTHPDFFWLPNFLETLLSSLLWKPLHSASLSYGLRKILNKYANETDVNNVGFVDFQGHDFSFRGMQHPESAISSGLGFLTNFSGTDTVPTLMAAKHYYNTDNAGFSVPASEHSVMTAYGREDEIEGFKRIIKLYPTGIVSVVSDSFDLWSVCTKFIKELKEEILSRDGKLVIRPDSGDPVDIICGTGLCASNHPDVTNPNDKNFDWRTVEKTPSEKGVIELLWDVFGGTVNEQGYKVLDSHIGAILGDGVTLQRAEQICKRLKAKGFASTNIVLGIGSYSMGYCTRDNQGSAMKATYVELEVPKFGEFIDQNLNTEIIGRQIFKDPITDDGTKKSATGLLTVSKDAFGVISLNDKVSWELEGKGLLHTIYKNGEFQNQTTLTQIRERLKK
jgi:nicotinamide phosphoribosyltransferase